jgi:CspA family cold shock protein
METGTVKFYNETKGYGFIIPEADPNSNIFVHVSALPDRQRGLIQNEKVEFEREQSSKGINAVNVKIIAES